LPRKTSSEIVAVLDACVLFPASLRDTLLRLAETPRQYIPKWSDRIIEELTRNLQRRHQLDPRKTDHLAQQLRLHFPEAFILDYEKRIAEMTNHPKDRHVLAAAVQSGAGIIVTFNLRDFPASSLAPRGVEAWHPDDFLIDILNRFSEMVIPKLRDQAATIGRDLPTLLRTLRIGVPRFAADVAAKLNLDIS